MTVEQLEDKLVSLSAKEIIMAMVNGLRKKHTNIDMTTYGRVVSGVCYGCAATNCIIEATGIDPFEEICITSNLGSSKGILYKFESAVDSLRKGCVSDFNSIWNYAEIYRSEGLCLPYLYSCYTEYELEQYERLAEEQDLPLLII